MSFLDREHSVAPPGYNRWLVPPAALALHLSIGQIYAYSVFNKPLADHGGWSLLALGVIFQIALAMLGASAAIFGKWVERVGPRRTMFTAALFFGGGFLVAALGVATKQLWLIYLGNGVLGGIGLGLGYISPVSTLIKWFPDRPGVATGMAIMGFGGGAMIASPLSVIMMNNFGGGVPANGITQTFVVLGLVYFVFMMFGAFTIRVPRPGWAPAGYDVNSTNAPGHGMITRANVAVDTAMRTPQFWLLFAVLFLNVTAGIGILGQASVMIQEMFSDTTGGRTAVSAAAAAGFVGLLSLFNMGGRFFWSSLSDRIGRKTTYAIFFSLGAILYFLIPITGNMGNVTLFVIASAIILTMYGGGFATIPAYLRDMFGTMNVGAIHGRLLLAWSAAAIVGPYLVNGLRQSQIDAGVPPAEAYNLTMLIMVGLLVVGFICNLLIRPVDPKFHYNEANTAPGLPGATPAATRSSGD
ncbi:OFA family MFS transporter [Deinococcus deserti]|uniref:Putative oxalate:formate antiporter OFA putative membrane protein n=1 Tax=Deinococcus deserti (strain DSM 17065 / CIP 109153 / LMG 22923 / VCD115) TaxID=546414 RepID=C1D330_DEIDV|nr:OFA family MFS transporter [Deinococcus deserti]ACO47819.1 putative oxalate:formate antiporter OFA; putative membrane protein [Deinococcus deserti VCD115]